MLLLNVHLAMHPPVPSGEVSPKREEAGFEPATRIENGCLQAFDKAQFALLYHLSYSSHNKVHYLHHEILDWLLLAPLQLPAD